MSEPDLTQEPIEIEGGETRNVGSLRARNTSQAFIHKLPDEVLVSIFREAYDSTTSSSTDECGLHRSRLVTVCFRWKDIISHTPQLWTHIFLSFRRRQQTDRLRLHLDRSGNLDLDVTLSFQHATRSLSRRKPALFQDEVDADLVQNLHRITQLQLLDVPPPTLNMWSTHFPSLPRLRSLEIVCWGPTDVRSLDLVQNTSLSHACFTGMDIKHIEVFTEAICTLSLDSISIDICIHLFFSCRNLRQFRALCCRSPDEDGVEWETSPINPRKSITLPRLKVLSWYHDDLPWANILFQHLNAPALEELRWNNMLLDEDWNEENLQTAGFWAENPLWAVKNVLSWLTEQNYWDEEGSHVGPFVDLTHISIDIDQSDKTYGWVHAVEEDFAQIVDIVCRRAVPGKSLLLEFSFRPHTYSEEAFSERALEALSKRELIISFEEDPDK
ncbi:hypothetical protein NP233_g3211 [Leucocoprinus birnbaumii]|uniref:F-box domain-containing protein n=1 Tax=Leucocoprinus birnbaumii TaxID=56174 RepID=A0AAD5VYB7_9AGAR|nr:hypothetical protein NP233_g3211 [Leucocoprinus birnbaumii]